MTGLRLWLSWQVVVDVAVAAVLSLAPAWFMSTTGLLPDGHTLYVRVIGVIALTIGLLLAPGALRPPRWGQLIAASVLLRAVWGLALLVFAAPDATLHPLLRLAGPAELGTAAVTLGLMRHAGVGLGAPGDR